YNVVMDVVKRYDVDGIHFDDYFYPYNDGKFPDDEQWNAAKDKNSSISREDWRRAHVNAFIERVYQGIKSEKKLIKFGLSPFGIWRPKNPASIAGYDQYNMLYADAKLWLNNGWVDYWTPQLYWPVNQIPQSFPVLLGWWAKENTMKRNLWPGMIINRPKEEKTADEIFNQIMITRGFVPDAPGEVHFSMKSFMKDSSAVNSMLKNGPYKRPAIVPTSPWLDDASPDAPVVTATVENDSIAIVWNEKLDPDIFRSVVYFQFGTKWEYVIISAPQARTVLPLQRKIQKAVQTPTADKNSVESTENLTSAAVTVVDRMGNESGLTIVRVPSVISNK
ncbi:MAG: glycoside hydrolase family 10 protein, partial [Bacteroidota bacterium]